MELQLSIRLPLIAMLALSAGAAPAAQAQVVESIDPVRSVTARSTATLTEAGSGYTIRCTHDFVIQTTAFTRTSSVSIEAANNLYTSCRDTIGGTCIIRINGRWTITASTTRSGTIRLDNTVTVDCTNRVVGPYSCVFVIQSGQSLAFTFTNPLVPATTGTLVLDVPNTIRSTIDSSTNCPLGPVGTRLAFTLSERFSMENLRIR